MMTISPKKAWFLTLFGALFFFYGFFQTNMMTALQGPLMQDFKASATDVGFVSAFYFYSTILFIIPAGLILDRFSIRKILLANMAIIIVGTLIFAYSGNLFLVGVARFVCGIMSAFSLLACLKLASLVQPPEKLALASSLIITIGMFGGMLSSILTQTWVAYFGWRGALILIAALGALIALILWMAIHLPHEAAEEKELKEVRSHLGIGESLWIVIKKWQNWGCGLFTTTVNLPVAIFGALFGINYLTQIYKISAPQAASITSMLFFGMIFGSPFFGWLANYMKQRRLPMVLGSIACLALVLILLYVPLSNLGLLFILFFAIGLTSAAQVLGYPVIAESNTPDTTATALSLASILIMGLGYGLGLPFVGWLIDLGLKGPMPLEAYHNAFMTIPIGILIGVILSLFIKETKHLGRTE
jgi:MFS family permease